MSDSNTLAMVAVLMSALSLILSSFSVWPSWKDHLASIRDAILWIALVFVIVGVANHSWRAGGWRQPRGGDAPKQPVTRAQPLGQPRAVGPASYATLESRAGLNRIPD